MNKSSRNQGLDVLRNLAMMMVVILHYLGKGTILPSAVEAAQLLKSNPNSGVLLNAAVLGVWLLEALCIVAVNSYMIISGFFLCETGYKISRLFKLYIQLWIYSVGVGICSVVLGIVPQTEVDLHYFLQLIFPVSMEHYWFMTAYIYFFLLLPLLGRGISHLNKQQHRWIMLIVLFTFSILKSILPVRMDFDQKGYDALWYICVFIVASYVRKYKPAFFEKKRNGISLYLIGVFGIVAELAILWVLYITGGSMSYILNIPLEYNHLLPFMASLGLVCFFAKIKVSPLIGKLAAKAGSLSLGVYLLHENLGLRYFWQELFGSERLKQEMDTAFMSSGFADASIWFLLLKIWGYAILAALCVFLVGIGIEAIRVALEKQLHRLLLHVSVYKQLCLWIGKMDESFGNSEKKLDEQ